MNFAPQRLPSQQIATPDEVTNNYNTWLADWQKRYDALMKMGGGGSSGNSLADFTKGDVAQIMNNQYGGDPYRSGNTDFSNPVFQEISIGSGHGDPGGAGTVNMGSSTFNFGGDITNQLGAERVAQIAAFQPSGNTPSVGPDPAAVARLQAEKDGQTNQFNSQLDAMGQATQTQQNAFTNQTGGGFAGGVLTNGGPPQTYQNVNLPTSQAAPYQVNSAFMPWNTPGYAPSGGLGGLGGYNPNPWSPTANTGAGSSNTNGASSFGGPFSNKNPFSLGG